MEKVTRTPSRSDEASATSPPPPIQYDEATEARVRRKLDWNMMPIFFVLYMLAFLDRGNIGNAVLAGMSKDLNFKGDDYTDTLTIFYVTYVVFEFALLFWKIFPPHIVGTIVVFSWGVFATLMAAAQAWGGVMALRFFLGAFEAAYAPGIIYLLSFFYLRSEVGLRCGLFASAAPIASTFAGALAYGVLNGHSHFRTWRLLFLIEGLPTILMAPVAWFFIPDSPEKAKFLTEEEKDIVRARAIRQTGMVGSDRLGGVDLKALFETLLDAKAWVNALMYFGTNVSYASLPVFLPTILNEMGFNAIDSQGLSAPPYFVAFLMAVATTFIADRTQQRGLILIFTSALGGIGYIILATDLMIGVRYFAVYLAAAGVFSTIPNILAWTLNNQGSDTRRGASLVLINVVGQCGPILGTRLYPTTEAPRYTKGMSICAGFMFFTTLCALALRFLLVWENSRLERKYPKNEAGKVAGEFREQDGAQSSAIENYGPRFRYVL